MRHSIILLIIGVAFLGNNLGWWPNLFAQLHIWWPLILIALGLSGLLGFHRCKPRGKQGENHHA
jgi:hypothetical protein